MRKLLHFLWISMATAIVHLAFPKSSLQSSKSLPLITFSSALHGHLPIGAYSGFVSKLSERVAVWETGPVSVTTDEIERVGAELGIHFDPILALGHHTGANVARKTQGAKWLVTIDPVEVTSENDGTRAFQQRMQRHHRSNTTDVELLSGIHTLDPYLTILSDGQRANYAFAEHNIKLRGMQFGDIFDERERWLFTISRSNDISPDVRDWIITALWSICGVAQL